MRFEPGSLGVLLVLAVVFIAPEAQALAATDPWDAAAREAMPIYLKIWLGLMMLNNLAATAFLKNHVPARWWFAGFVISHGIVVVMGMQDITVYAGQVSGRLALLLYFSIVDRYVGPAPLRSGQRLQQFSMAYR